MTISIYIDPTRPVLNERAGPPPLTTQPNPQLAHPHQQLTQNAPEELQDELAARAALLPGVELEVIWQLVITSYRFAVGHPSIDTPT